MGRWQTRLQRVDSWKGWIRNAFEKKIVPSLKFELCTFWKCFRFQLKKMLFPWFFSSQDIDLLYLLPLIHKCQNHSELEFRVYLIASCLLCSSNGHAINTPVSEGNIIQAPEGEGCPRCGGFVYHADQIFSKDKAYHKQCFKCTVCHRQLDSRIACDGPDRDIYCNGECIGTL